MTRTLRHLCLILALALLVSVCPIPAAANPVTQEAVLTADTLSDAEALSSAASSAREQLSTPGKVLYDYLKTQIERIADGRTASTEFALDAQALLEWQEQGVQITFTNKDFSAESIPSVDDFYASFFAQFDLATVLEALMHDCPYSLYWFDKDAGVNYSCQSDGDKVGGKYTRYTMTSLSFSFPVSADYQSGGSSVKFNTAKAAAAKTAAANAKAIVNKYSSKSDYEKLLAYRNEICKLVSYDSTASTYGAAWQVISVFDGNSTTNVVCEGYAKAFQYLCDLSTFDSASCNTVRGTLIANGAKKASHMWNIVTMDDGRHYVVDVTNSDANTAGSDGSLFLAGGAGSIASGYTLHTDTGSTLQYRYEDTVCSLWGTDADSILAVHSDCYHQWHYSLNDTGDAILATCQLSECRHRDGGSVRMELDEVLLYDGKVKTADVVSTLTTGDEVTVIYDCAKGCKTIGSHTATLTISGVSLTRAFTIEAAPTSISLVNPAVQNGSVSFGVRSNRTTSAMLVTAYYQNGAMVDLSMQETTTANANYTVAASSRSWDTCCVFLLEAGTMAPLCQNLQITR